MEIGDLEIYYKGAMSKNFDQKLKRAMEKLEYKETGAGYNLVDGIRDISYFYIGEKEIKGE